MINGIIFRILEKQNVIVTGQGMPVTELYYKINLKAVTKKNCMHIAV
jgi:predicted transcriptional regulator